jgi:hypothetical protein
MIIHVRDSDTSICEDYDAGRGAEARECPHAVGKYCGASASER